MAEIALAALVILFGMREWSTHKAHGRVVDEMRRRDEATARERAELLERIQRPEIRPRDVSPRHTPAEQPMRPAVARDYANIGVVMPMREDDVA